MLFYFCKTRSDCRPEGKSPQDFPRWFESISDLKLFIYTFLPQLILMAQLKAQLLEKCRQFAENQIQNIRQAIQMAEQSSSDDTKSSAGDKYETGREMLKQELDRLAYQLKEAQKLIEVLKKLDTSRTAGKVLPGSLVYTNFGIFFISIGAGQIALDEQSVFAISAASPLALKLLGLKEGDSENLNGRIYKIEKVI